MSASALLSRLDGVRQTSPGRWIAKCPAHDDRHPSLAIRELDDGRTLLHCFAGCDAGEILGALGLDFEALYPERALGDRLPRERLPFSAIDALRCISFEAMLASVAAGNVANGIDLTPEDRERLSVAVARINNALGVVNA